MLASAGRALAVMLVNIITKVVITSELNPKHPWTPETCQLGEHTFAKVCKWNREFTRFATGRALDLRKDKNYCASCGWLDDIVNQRHHQSVAAVQEALQADEHTDADTHKSAKKRKVHQRDQNLAPPYVTVTFPRVEFANEVFEEKHVKVGWAVKAPEIWIEMSPEIMGHLQLGIRSSKAAEQAAQAGAPNAED